MTEQTYQDRPSLAKWNELVETANSAARFVTGYYNGEVKAPGTGTKRIELGFQPEAVLIVANGTDFPNRAALLVRSYAYIRKNQLLGEITPTGFTVGSACDGDTEISPNLNTSDKSYFYIAFH